MRAQTFSSSDFLLRPELDTTGPPPRWGLLYAVEDFPIDALIQRFRLDFPETPLLGATSFRGVFSKQRLIRGAALLLADDSDLVTAATALRSVGAGGARSEAAQAAREVMAALGRVPDIVVLHATPGFEEAVLLGLVDALGPQVEVYGGSAGDDSIDGRWRVFTDKAVASEGFALAGLCAGSGATLHGGFLSGYLPTAKRGVVTQTRGRVILEIDGEPAARAYNRWTGGVIAEELDRGGNVLLKTNLHPLGRVIEARTGVPQRLLSHPHEVHRDGGLALFTDIAVGDVVELMIGTPEPLVTRAGKIVSRARGRANSTLTGGLLVYCGGCLAAVIERADDIANAFDTAIGGAPFVGVATFGEQGCFIGERNKLNRHGNLMCSTVLFGKR